ncbi:uncharacterized protein LOC111359874 [Spodoptera litura]|uniref:Uncharacterized protein LOC111359874 n=1 Tax=Spodoptera litura TaxID=69820 RepID=A0A9J7J1S9_SPOLT|nr:uncharacterized protein LOC111359874 [Spodoptera litura]
MLWICSYQFTTNWHTVCQRVLKMHQNRDNDLRYVESQRGRKLLLYNGFQFHKKYDNKDGSVMWRCTKAPACFGSVRVLNEAVQKENPHSCDRSEITNVVKEALHNLKDRVKSLQGEPISTVYQETLLSLHERGLNLVTNLPEFKNIKTGLYNARNKSHGVKKTTFKNGAEVEIPGTYQDFLLFDYQENETRIIGFASQEGRQRMATIRDFYADGTFKCCIKPFYQLYVIHGDLSNDSENSYIIPLVYVLLMSKKEKTYTTMFRLIKAQIPNWNPKKIVIDFEKAVMNSIQTVLPNTEIKGCYFHFCQALVKRAKQLKVTKNRNQLKHLALCLALPLLPEHLIDDAYLYIMEDCPRENNITKFNDYLVKTWLEGGKFPTHIWNVCGQKNRTTNALESWHATINRFIPNKKINMLKLLHVLKRDALLQNASMLQRQNGASTSSSANGKENEDRINRAIQELVDQKIVLGHCLEKLAPFIYFKV